MKDLEISSIKVVKNVDGAIFLSLKARQGTAASSIIRVAQLQNEVWKDD